MVTWTLEHAKMQVGRVEKRKGGSLIPQRRSLRQGKDTPPAKVLAWGSLYAHQEGREGPQAAVLNSIRSGLEPWPIMEIGTKQQERVPRKETC